MLLIVGTIRLPADNLPAARPAMQAMAEASRAEKIPTPKMSLSPDSST